MGQDLGDRRLGDETDMRRHALFAAHRHHSTSGVEMDLLLTELERCAAFVDDLRLHAKHAFIALQAAVDIGDGQIQMVYALDLHWYASAVYRSEGKLLRTFAYFCANSSAVARPAANTSRQATPSMASPDCRGLVLITPGRLGRAGRGRSGR